MGMSGFLPDLAADCALSGQMASDPQRILNLLERTLTAPEPTASLRALTSLRRELDALERANVARALQEGETFAAIAKPLGISRQAAHRRYRDLATGTPAPRLSAEARAALVRRPGAGGRRRPPGGGPPRHGSRSIDSEHLLLALAPRGLDVDAARRRLGPPTINAPEPAGLDPKLHARLVRNGGPLQVDHLLRAALADPDAKRLFDSFF